MSSNSGEKTERPTDKRLQDARKKGLVAGSRDLTSAVLLIASVAVVWLIGGYLGGVLQATVKEQIEFAAAFKGQFTGETASHALWQGLTGMFWVLTPIFMVLISFAFLGNYLQIGSIFAFRAVAPQFKNLNPAEGFKQKFLKAGPYIELGKTVLKIIIAALIAFYVLRSAREEIVRLIAKPPDIAALYAFGLVLEVGLKIGLVFLVLGGADFFLQRFLLRRDLKMTRREVREEFKETEGNPLIKSQRRARHREILSENLTAAAGDADVVLANLPHIAVSLKYERGKSNAPVVTAKGAELMAAKICQIAVESGVPVKIDATLARALYEIEVGREIPEKLYGAVAVVLQWIYEMKDEE